jgi:hypothetical protein
MVEGIVDQIEAEIKDSLSTLDRGSGFAPTNQANQASTQYGHGIARGTNQSHAPFSINNIFGHSVQ